ncbi:MAG: Unknown protein [uncultured Aureispira sp.]|uniref:Uncharacterized protein n=1 Tax=uncultured Aureispira sp. TaxID=1331704 RepID=A0A6S6U9K4_9BACT|nr:MAG: Unknown protein [uncultured Aureispira sp.]
MQKLILLLFIAPLGLFAQSDTAVKRTHQEAESQFMQRYPQAEKIDLELLTAQQKDAHKQCNTCGKKKAPTSQLEAHQVTMEALLSDQQRLTAIIKNLEDNESTDLGLLKKYNKALSLNLEKVETLELALEQAEKKQAQIALKKAAR